MTKKLIRMVLIVNLASTILAFAIDESRLSLALYDRRFFRLFVAMTWLPYALSWVFVATGFLLAALIVFYGLREMSRTLLRKSPATA
jgi:hypothetical protein